jgi:hypothetical protein
VPLLEWRPAARTDRSHLERFACTEPARYDRQRRRPVHPRHWELDLQSEIRTLSPTEPGLYLGFDDTGLAAVYLFSPLSPSQSLLDVRVGEYKLRAVAVALRHRHQGGNVAWETITEALATILDDSAVRGYQEARVFGEIHQQNVPSQRMCERRGFRRVGPAGVPEHELWSIPVTGGDPPGP